MSIALIVILVIVVVLVVAVIGLYNNLVKLRNMVDTVSYTHLSKQQKLLWR